MADFGETAKSTLHTYLVRQREAVEWKLEGLSERDARWPLTGTGSNLLGIVKHLGCMEYGYFGDVFARPPAEEIPWLGPDAEANADMFATEDETCASVLAFYRRACEHADATINSLAIDDVGTVPWWPEATRRVTLHRVLAHMIAETSRHAGHLDILRELTDGSVGMRAQAPNMPTDDDVSWDAYLERLRRLAETTSD